MPFGPAFSPSLALSLLKASLTPSGIEASVRYFSIDFAERIGQHFYSGISTYSRPSHKHLVGEWIFAGALFGEQGEDAERAYLDEVLLRRNKSSSERAVSGAMVERLV